MCGAYFNFLSNFNRHNEPKGVLSHGEVCHGRSHIGDNSCLAVLVGFKLKSILEEEGQLRIPVGNVMYLSWVQTSQSSVSDAIFESHQGLVDHLRLLDQVLVMELHVTRIFRACQVDDIKFSRFH